MAILAIERAYEALARFLEADEALTRDKYVAKKAPGLRRHAAAFFRGQGRYFGRSFAQLQGVVDANAAAVASQESAAREAFSSADWLPLWFEAAAETSGDFEDVLEDSILDALLFSGGRMLAGMAAGELDLGISWNLENPRAVAYAREHAAGQVRLINETTQTYLNSLITQAVEEGWSYTKLSIRIGGKFSEFATGGANPRSRRIAVYELGDAYEAGNEMMARELEGAGLKIEKRWLTVGDDRVRPTHRENQGAGWIGMDELFPSGDDRPPSDPGCRCVTLHRRVSE